MQIKQVATILGYGESQILEVFRNTLPTKLYWILFPILDLRQAVETAKRILTKEMGQSSASLFMNIKDGTDRRVSFSTRDELGDKIDKLTVAMSRLAAKDSHEKRSFKPQIYKSRGQNKSFNQENFQNRPSDRNTGKYTSSRTKQNYRDSSSQGNFRGYKRQNSRGGYRNGRHNDYKRGRNGSRERIFTRNYNSSRNRSPSNSRSRSGSRANTNKDRIRCYNCREYDHFARDCPNSREKREVERLKQILDMEAEGQTYRHDSPIENYRGPLNL